MALRTNGGAGRLRIGVCGTGYWADLVHLPALAATDGIELVGVQGRNQLRVRELADKFAIRAFDDFDRMLDEVDAVSFVVPPSVQSGLALQAAQRGKHLLLEKPIAATLEDANRLVDVIAEQGLASTVFLMRLFIDGVRDLIARAKMGHPTSGHGHFGSGGLLPGSPFAQSPWRMAEYGTLWDTGPHVLSVLVSVLGPVSRVRGTRLDDARFDGAFEHNSGATSTMTLNQRDVSTTAINEYYAFGDDEQKVGEGPFTYDRRQCFIAAASMLRDRASGLPNDAPDAAFGRDLVAVLEQAETSARGGGIWRDVVLR